jgi:hypothetical protein
MIIDTDVITWYMKGNQNAYKAIENLNHFYITVVTYMELVQGMRDKNELSNLRRSLHTWGSKILYISEEISVKAMFFVEQHFLSHSIQLKVSQVCTLSSERISKKIGKCFARRTFQHH